MELQGTQVLKQSAPSIKLQSRVQRKNLVVLASKKDAKQVKQIDIPQIATIIASGVAVTASNSAQAITVDDGVQAVVGAVQTGGDLLKSGLGYVDKGLEIGKEGYGVVEPYVRQAVTFAAPYAQKGVQIGGQLLNQYVIPTIQRAVPVVESSVKQFAEAQGVNASGIQQQLNTIGGKVGEATTSATPLVTKFQTFVTTSQPVILAEYAAALVALYYVSPPLFKTLLSLVRGYAGSVAPAAVLNIIQSDGNSFIVDIRQPIEKERSGRPDLPGGYQSKLIDVDYASIDNRRVRNQLKSPDRIETQVTALQIASLKKIGKGSSIYILDKYGTKAVDVAKALSGRGFGKVYVVQGGFDGRSGWSSSKLSINRRQVYQAEILPQVFGSGSGRKYLPGS